MRAITDPFWLCCSRCSVLNNPLPPPPATFVNGKNKMSRCALIGLTYTRLCYWRGIGEREKKMKSERDTRDGVVNLMEINSASRTSYLSSLSLSPTRRQKL